MNNKGTYQKELFGIELDKNNPHIARTIMLEELTILLNWVVDPNASKTDYLKAIIEDNCLQKRSASNRDITARRLAELYTFDTSIPLFRALIFLWRRDEMSRPLLALLSAYARDSILRDTAKNIISLPLGTVITRQNMEQWVEALDPGRFSEVTLRSVAKNINSSWTQSGHLRGRINKTRIPAVLATGATAYALFLSYLSGARGTELFQTEYVKILDCTENVAVDFAQEASQRGWITFKRVAEVKEVQFPNFLNQ